MSRQSSPKTSVGNARFLRDRRPGLWPDELLEFFTTNVDASHVRSCRSASSARPYRSTDRAEEGVTHLRIRPRGVGSSPAGRARQTGVRSIGLTPCSRLAAEGMRPRGVSSGEFALKCRGRGRMSTPKHATLTPCRHACSRKRSANEVGIGEFGPCDAGTVERQHQMIRRSASAHGRSSVQSNRLSDGCASRVVCREC